MTSKRTVGLTVLTMPTPAIADGRPTVPTYWAQCTSNVTLRQGPKHIHAIKDPDPKWNPRTSGWYTPPPESSSAMTGRWTVSDLPDPAGFSGGYYWLGEATSLDGTSGIQSSCRQWAPNGSTPHAPSWHSFFPFKPSVRSHDSYLPTGGIVNHPRGVHFNTYYIEHMWTDLGRARHQPFSWVIAAMILSYTDPREQHLLDAGRNPDDVGFPRISADACNTPRTIRDGLSYRNSLTVSPEQLKLTASVGSGPTVRQRSDAALRPKMFFGIFNGASSYVGAYGPGARRIQKGRVEDTGDQLHRYYTLGRRQGAISQELASHMLVFEIRTWDQALNTDDLKNQYDQLSSTYSFERYRAVR